MLLDILLFFSPGLELCCIGGLCNGAGTSCKPIPKPCTYLLKVICISFSLSPKILATTNLVQSIWECIQQNHLQNSGNKFACHLLVYLECVNLSYLCSTNNITWQGQRSFQQTWRHFLSTLVKFWLGGGATSFSVKTWYVPVECVQLNSDIETI
jgi:hypothetical protein